MASGAYDDDDGLISDINVTPLVDIFMVLQNGDSQLFRCDPQDQNSYLQVKLIGQLLRGQPPSAKNAPSP